MKKGEIAKAYETLRKFARENYERDGWDYFIECVDLADFTHDIQENELCSYEAVKAYYGKVFRFMAERRADIEATRF